jgi:hypothetical protein
MTAPTAAPPRPGAKNGQGARQAPQVQPRPFVAGTRRGDRATYDETKTITATTQDLPVFEVDPNGYLRELYLLVECTTATNAATVAFKADAPFNIIDTIQFSDTNNKPLVGPMTGWDLYICVKYGGYSFIDDVKQSPVYSVTSGAGATGGSFTFVLPLPVEISRRDGLGSLTNKSASSTFDVSIRLAPSSSVYSTAPTNAGSVRVRIQQVGWMDPNSTDMRGRPVAQNPPAVATTQFWSKQSYTMNSGAVNFRLQGLDSLIRNFIFVLVDSAASRTQGDSDWFDPFNLQYENVQPIQRLRTVWRYLITEWYGYTAAADAAGGRDSGVYPEPYTFDFGSKPGNESRLGYLPARSATNISINGTVGGTGTHTLYVLVNKIVPADGDPMSLAGR